MCSSDLGYFLKLKDDKPTEDINDLILKVIDAPTKKEKRRAEREER